ARPGALGNFRESMLVRIVENGGAGNSYQVLSVKDCTYKEGGYWVEMDVEITTPEIVVRVPFTVRSQDVAGHGREWYVDWTKTPPGPVPEKGYIWLGTKRGEQLGRLRKEAQAFASKWAEDLKRGKVKAVLKATTDPKKWESGSAIDMTLVNAEQRDKARK